MHLPRQYISVSNMELLLYQKLWSTLRDISSGAWLAMALRVDEPKFLLVMQQGKMWCNPWLYLSWAFSSYIYSFFLGTTLCVFVFSWPCKSSWLYKFQEDTFDNDKWSFFFSYQYSSVIILNHNLRLSIIWCIKYDFTNL